MIPRNKTHGMTGTLIYKSWSEMKRRCNNPKDQKFYRYGKRGIKVCERWQSFDNFYKDMGDKPTPKHTLNRIDNDGDYTPENCNWALPHEQSRNKSNNKRYAIFENGKFVEYCMTDLADKFDIRHDIISRRIKRGWSIATALLIPPLISKDITPGRSKAMRIAIANRWK